MEDDVTDETNELMEKARVLLAAATPGAVSAHASPRSGDDATRLAWGNPNNPRRSVWVDIPLNDAEAMAFAVNNLAALCDALAAEKQRADEAEAGAAPAKNAADLLAKVMDSAYSWPHGVRWAVGEAHRLLTGGPPDGVYVRAPADKPRDLDAEVVAGVQASRTTPDPKP